MNNQIHILLNSQSKEIESKNEILREVETFYKNLYQSEGNDKNQVRDNLTHIKKRLSEDDCKSLNRPIQENEIQHAIKNMKNEKSHHQTLFGTLIAIGTIQRTDTLSFWTKQRLSIGSITTTYLKP